jgi:pimeloyl-ACP methyl ester carboxylesterase
MAARTDTGAAYPRGVRMPGGRGGAVLAAVVVLAAGCSGADRSSDEAPTTPSPTSAAPDATEALRERCLSAMPEDAPLQAVTLAGGGAIEAARIGPEANERVAILLPQIGGFCGWGRWATAAAQAGVTSLLVNPCGYGATVCTDEQDADPLHEVAAAVDLARGRYGAKRVVLLGTSMGGSLTVMAVAAGADVDAWADVSGPPAWEGVELATLAGALPDDGLVVMAPSDGREIFAAAEALADTAGVRFVPGRSGHGWDLLVNPVTGSVTRIGRQLVALAEGRSGT